MDEKDWRKEAKKFYKSKEWRQVREYVLMRDYYMCVKCGQPAIEVHHKKELKEGLWDPTINLNPDNLISLCKKCHARHHKSKNVQYFDENGYLIPD